MSLENTEVLRASEEMKTMLQERMGRTINIKKLYAEEYDYPELRNFQQLKKAFIRVKAL